MGQLTEHGSAVRDDLATRHAVSAETVEALMAAILSGGGSQAQFDIPELGGMGQWTRGGMTTVADMFDTEMQAKVAALCEDLAQAAVRGPLFERAAPKGAWQGQGMGLGAGAGLGETLQGGGWWPEPLGQPSAQGAQNDMSYAVFPERQRLAVNLAGRVTVHDTGGHEIAGISQEQGMGRSWIFTSQYGAVDLAAMPVVYDEEAAADKAAETAAEEAAAAEAVAETAPAPVAEPVAEVTDEPAPSAPATASPAQPEPEEGTWGPVSLELPTREPTVPPVAFAAAAELSEATDAAETAPNSAPDSTFADTAFGETMAPEPPETPEASAPLASPGSEGLYSGARLLVSADQIFAALEKLGDLRDINILTEEEFAAKKAELLARL